MSLSASDRAGGVSRALGGALLLMPLLLGGVLSSDAPAQVQNLLGARIVVDYHDGTKSDHQHERFGLGFVDAQLSGGTFGGEFGFLMNANSKGVELSANLLSSANQASTRDLTWVQARYDSIAAAMIEDTITVIGAENGRIQYHFDLEGELFYSWRRDGGAVQMERMITSADLYMVQNGTTESIVNRELSDPGGLFGGVRGEPNQDTLTIHESHTIAFPFTAGEDNDVLFGLTVTTAATVNNIDGGEFAGTMRSNFGSTATLMGVTLFDESGNVITDASIVSASGFEYPIFVPEPSSALLFAAGAFALCRRRRKV